MCLVKWLTTQFGGFLFRLLHCHGFDDAKAKPKRPLESQTRRIAEEKSHFLNSLEAPTAEATHDAQQCTMLVKSLFFFLSHWKTNKKTIITGETQLFPLPVSLLEDDGMQEGIGGAQVERKRQSVTSQVARRKISQTNGGEEVTARTGSVLAKWDAAKGCHSGALLSFHMTDGDDAPEIKLKVFFHWTSIVSEFLVSFFFS